MWICCEIPDTAASAAEECAKWLSSPEMLCSAAGAVITITAGNDFKESHLAARVTEVQIP